MKISSFPSPDGAVLSYTTSGQGPALLLVHGTTSDSQRWRPVAPGLATTHTLHALDRRGRRHSADGADYTLEREIEDVVAWIHALPDAAQVDLLGHSFGAICALEAAVRVPQRIRRLALYEPPIRLESDHEADNPALALLEGVAQGRNASVLEAFYRDVLQLPEPQIAALQARADWQAKVDIAPTVARELDAVWHYRPDAARLATLTVPTLLLLGQNSLPRFGQASRYLQQTLPDARLEILPGQAHGAIDGDPDTFVRVVRAFLCPRAEA